MSLSVPMATLIRGPNRSCSAVKTFLRGVRGHPIGVVYVIRHLSKRVLYVGYTSGPAYTRMKQHSERLTREGYSSKECYVEIYSVPQSVGFEAEFILARELRPLFGSHMEPGSANGRQYGAAWREWLEEGSAT